jgi:hypothetical protein
MTQQLPAAAQRRRTIGTLGLLGAILIAGGLALFSGPTRHIQKERPAPAAKPPVQPVATTPPRPQPAKPPPPKPAKPAKPLIDETVIWVDPPEWKRLPASGMRYASYEIPAAPGDKVGGELNVFILTGDVEANIQRWIDEFSGFDLKTLVRSKRTVHGMPQSIVEIPRGHFDGGMGDTKASDNYGLLGAIIVAPSTNEFFFKLTGPSKTIKTARKPFYKMLDSIQVEKKGATPAASGTAVAPAGSASPTSAASVPAAPAAPAPPPPAGSAAHP